MNVVLIFADLGGTAWLNDVLFRHCVEHVARRESFGLQQARVEVQHDGALFAAIDVGDDCAGDGGELGTDEVEAEVVELLLGEVPAGEAELQDGHGGGAEVDDLRRQDAGRQVAENVLRSAADLGIGGVETGTLL